MELASPLARLRAAARRPALLSLLDQGAVSGFGFLAGIAAARLVDIHEFGRFALVLIVANLAQSMHNALVTSPLMTLAGAGSGRMAGYRPSMLAGSVILALAMAVGTMLVLAAFFAVRDAPFPAALVLAAGALTVAQNLQLTGRRALFAFGEGGQALAMDIARAVLLPAIIAALWGAGVAMTDALLIAILAGTALVTSVPALSRLLTAPVRRWRPRAVWHRHWRLARWLTPIVFVTFGQEQLVWLVAGGVLGDEALGGLRAAQYLVGIVLLTLTATENIVPTAAGRAYAAGGEEALRRYLVRILVLLGPFVVGLLLLVAVPASLWLRLLFGAPYAAYASSVQVMALGAFFIFLRDMATHAFRARQQTRAVFRAFTISLVVALALVAPLLKAFGAVGAAAVVAASHAASMVYLVLAARRGSPEAKIFREGVPERC